VGYLKTPDLMMYNTADSCKFVSYIIIVDETQVPLDNEDPDLIFYI